MRQASKQVIKDYVPDFLPGLLARDVLFYIQVSINAVGEIQVNEWSEY